MSKAMPNPRSRAWRRTDSEFDSLEKELNPRMRPMPKFNTDTESRIILSLLHINELGNISGRTACN